MSPTWTVWRIDDNANVMVVRKGLTQAEAQALVDELEALGHKQMYWSEESPPTAAKLQPGPDTSNNARSPTGL